jgi:hypothetical protein
MSTKTYTVLGSTMSFLAVATAALLCWTYEIQQDQELAQQKLNQPASEKFVQWRSFITSSPEDIQVEYATLLGIQTVDYRLSVPEPVSLLVRYDATQASVSEPQLGVARVKWSGWQADISIAEAKDIEMFSAYRPKVGVPFEAAFMPMSTRTITLERNHGWQPETLLSELY